jgi:hypothetical protein
MYCPLLISPSVSLDCNFVAPLILSLEYSLSEFFVIYVQRLYNNSYMIYIIRNPILWLGISAYGGGVFVSLLFNRRCSPDYFFRNVNKMAAWISDNKKR